MRSTRKEIKYEEEVYVTDSDETKDDRTSTDTTEQGANRGVVDRYRRTERELTAISSESVWGGSERSNTVECWSPATLNSRILGIINSVQEVQTQVKVMAQGTDGKSLEQLMVLLMESRVEDRKRDREREDRREEEERKRQRDREEEDRKRQRDREEEERRRIEREERREEERREQEERRRNDDREREERIIRTLKQSQPTIPQTVTIVNSKLPDMKDNEDIDTFIAMFEAALTAGNVPDDQWKAKLHAHLNPKTKLRIQSTIQDPDASYEDIKAALLGCGCMTFSAAAETLLTGDRGKVYNMEHRQCKEKLLRITEKVMTGATSVREAAQCITVALMRQNLVPSLKTYIDLKGEFDSETFSRTLDEWEATQPIGTSCFKKVHVPPTSSGTTQGKIPFGKKPIACYFCGKGGHISRDCRSRIAGDKPSTSQLSVKQEPGVSESHQPSATNTPSRLVRKEITCFTCQQKGHKSPQCPQRNTQVKRIQIPSEKVRSLRDNELFGSVGAHRLPVTCDSGADISVVPEECVDREQFIGDTCQIDSFNNIRSSGKLCNIVITLNGRKFERRAVTQPGKDLAWTACLSLPFANREEWSFVTQQMQDKFQQKEEDKLYLPPEMKDGILKSGILVSEGTLVVAKDSEQVPVVSKDKPVVETQQVEDNGNNEVGDSTNKEEDTGSIVETDIAEVNGGDEQKGECEEILVMGENSSVAGEAEGAQEGGSADKGLEDDLSVENIKSEVPRLKLAESTKVDETLAAARALADTDSEGYHWQDGLVFRTRLDQLGDKVEQLCLPKQYRPKCLHLAHEHFGHNGRNKMASHIRRFFYWPSITADSMAHIRSCSTCQKKDKMTPRNAMMQEREIVSIPSERVAIDIVGPFPTAKGGFRYLLTYLDMATRWPEVIPLRNTTTRIIIEQLTLIFSRCGFPTSIVSDNGPQFVSTSFQKWLKVKGITHVRASPYHPQGNGVVERMHRTLKGVIARCTENKGNWAMIVPMALYFVRCMPNRSTGLSPFRAKHGWEPTTPLQLLYKGWVQKDLGPVDLEQWTLENAERVQHMRDVAVVNLKHNSVNRKIRWDSKAQNRQFEKGEQVYLRKSGLNTTLADSWEGPYLVERRNTPLSYRINTGDRVLPSVHIQMLKTYIPRQDEPHVCRVTSVLEPDTVEDQLDDQYAEVKVTGSVVDKDRVRDVKRWEEDYSDTLMKEPGLTDMIRFKIETGDHKPIYQRPYNTPQSLKKSVDDELAWLLKKGYIRPSKSPWTSPMVTVRKPDGTARICVDFKAINSVTEPIPFYMPRVEEVLESVGKSCVISKLDLCKGYYQVPMEPDHICKTAFMCHQGRFEFLRMPFGVRNAPAIFQEMMQKLFCEYSEFCSPYMDDLIVFSTSWDDHVIHVRKVLDKLRSAGLTANPAKCHWGGKRMEFLGHLVGEGRMSVPKHRVETLTNFTKPTTKKGLRSFLGAIGFYRRYIDLLAAQTAVLTPLTTSQAPSRIVWAKESELAFHTILSCISCNTELCIPLPEDLFSVVTDASGLGIGGVLQVWREGQWEAAAFHSRQLRGAEQRYSATELEALALVSTINHFGYYLYGREFIAYSDHKPLCQLLSSDRLNPRLKRLAYKLQHWLVKIEYLPGDRNGMADALSREERPRVQITKMAPRDLQTPDASLASGDVGAPTPT